VALARAGLPVGQPYGTPHLIAGEIACGLDRYALHSALQDGAALTPLASRAALALGWGQGYGLIEVLEVLPGAVEILTGDPLNGDGGEMRLEVDGGDDQLRSFAYRLAPRPGVHVLSRWVGRDGTDLGVGSAAIELEGGARLGLLPYELLDAPAGWLARRRDAWAALFEWAGARPLPCRVPGGEGLVPYCFANPDGGEVLLAVANLKEEAQPACLSVPGLGDGVAVERLERAGTWVPEREPLHVGVDPWSVTALRWQGAAGGAWSG
jgi:hypothetical protein